MLEYGNLSPLEFEYVCQDVMQAKLGTALRRFPAGRDDGIDLIDDLETNHIVVQVKHYWKSSFSALKQALKAERAKVDRLSPGQYYLCCGQTLTPNQTRELYDLFSDYMTSEQNILTLLELDEFLTAPQNVGLLRKHFKLWLSASSILSELYNQEIFIDSEALLYDVADELPYYVQTGSYLKSRDILERERLLMIVGSPGVGKTTISKMLVLYFASIGYRVRYTTNGDLSGIKRAISADHSKEIILLDDCLGQCYFRLKDTQENELSTLIKFVKRNPGKILLLNANNFDPTDEAGLKQALHTIMHEFAHILHQRKNYDVAFDRITEDSYVGSNWYIYTDPETGSTSGRTLQQAWKAGFGFARGTLLIRRRCI